MIQFPDHHEIKEVHDGIDQIFVQLLANMKRFHSKVVSTKIAESNKKLLNFGDAELAFTPHLLNQYAVARFGSVR